MNRNITIVVILLILAVIGAYLVWLRGQYTQQMAAQTAPVVNESIAQPSIEPSPVSTPSVSPVASASAKEATTAAKTKTATSSATKK